MYEFVEERVRRLVAAHLGVGFEALACGATLREDLAANALDVVELAVAVEGEFGIVIAERILDDVRTYSDLVHAVGLLLRASRETKTEDEGPPPHVSARIVPAKGRRRTGVLERTGWLTPYLAQTIADAGRRAGRGARIELTIAPGGPESLAKLRGQFAGLAERGIVVSVRNRGGLHAPPSGTGEGVIQERQVAISPRFPSAN